MPLNLHSSFAFAFRPLARMVSWAGLRNGCEVRKKFIAGASLVISCGSLACSGEGETLPALSGGLDALPQPSLLPCHPGDVQDCAETISRESGVLTCWEGTKRCGDDEKWGACEGGSLVKRADPFSPRYSKKFKQLSLSAPVDCGASNACDPNCQVFIEPGPFVTPIDSANTPDWQEGPTPPWTPPAACASSDLCSTSGAPLEASCHPCVQTICDDPATDHCCSDGASPTSWDQACADAVYTVCGGIPPGTPNGGFCDWGALSQGNIRFGNGGLSGTVIGSTGNSSNTVWLETSTPCSYRDIITQASLNVRNNCTITGDVVVEGDVYFESGSSISGGIWSGGDVDLRNGVAVADGVTASGYLDLAAGSSVVGAVEVGGNVFVRSSSSISGNVTGGGNYNSEAQGYAVGDLWFGGSVFLNESGGTTEVTGNVESVGNIDGQTGADITGNATVNSGSSIAAGLDVGGSEDTGASVVAPSAPVAPVVEVPSVSDLARDLSLECSAAAGKGTSTYNASDLTLEPGIYGDVLMQGRNLILKPGAYVFDELEFQSPGDLRFDTDGQADPQWDISVCGQFLGGTGHQFYINGTSTRPDPHQVVIYSQSSSANAIRFYDSNNLSAIFIAPYGRIYLSNNNTVDGAIWGNELYTETSTTLNQGGANDCEGANLWGAACTGYSLYDDSSSSYMLGDEVHYGGEVYECIDAANCNSGGGYGGGAGYWPGQGASWPSAWELLGDCTVPPLTGGAPACPVELEPYPELWSTPCATGRDCQNNERCDNADTASACAHSKCLEGGFLEVGCDPCVDLICDPDGDGTTSDPCCTDSGSGSEWDASCVDRVATECDATCGAPELGCEHDMCLEGGGMVQNTSCDPCVVDVCAARPSCCTEDGNPATDEWDSSCVDLVLYACGTPGESVCDYAAYGADEVVTGDDCGVIDGALGGDTSGLNVDYGCSVADVFSQSNVVLYDATAQDVYSTGTITENGSTSTSSSNESQVMTAPTIPTKTFSCGSGSGADSHFGTADGNHPLSAGTYRDVSLFDDGSGAENTIELAAGTYNLRSLVLGDDTKLLLPPTGVVEINLCETISVGDNVLFESTSGSLSPLDALRIQIHSNGVTPSDVVIGEGSTVYGVITAPSSQIILSTPGAAATTTLVGLARASTVEVSDNAQIVATGLTGASCQNAGLGELGAAPVAAAIDACDYAIVAAGAVNIQGYHGGSSQSVEGGDVMGAAGNTFIRDEWGRRPQLSGSVYSSDQITLTNVDIGSGGGGQVAQAAGSCSSTSSVCGGSAAGCCVSGSPPSATAPTESISCPGAGNSGGSPSANTDWNETGLNWGDGLTLTAGTYTFSSFTLPGGNTLTLPASGDVILHVCGDVNLGQNLTFSGVSSSADALRLKIYATGNVTIGQSATAYAMINAEGGATLAQDATLYGTLWADTVSLFQARVVATDVAGTTACQAAWGGGGSVAPTCSVSTPTSGTVDESGSCVSNQGFTDGTCAGVDLALSSPCEDSIPICNHGSADFSGSVDLTFWPESAAALATESPDLSSALGSCTFSGAIEAGKCVSHDCSGTGLLNQDLTVMVNAPSSPGMYAVTECSYLDNWTVFVDGQTCSDVCLNPPCSAGLAPLVIEEDYEATCPDQMAPLWNTLRWDSSTPGASDVTFEATTDSGGSAVYTTIGQASLDGDVCNDFGPSPCPIDVTAALGLGTTNHPDTLYLRITLDPDGSDAATLEDWELTYSCRYDQ